MPLQFNQFVRALMAGGGGAAGLPALSSFALVGDSLTQFGAYYLGLNAVTLTRDAAGTVTFTKAAHGIYGPSTPVYILNCTDASYEGEYTATAIDANTLSLAGGVAGAAGTTTTTSLGGLLQTNRTSRRGYWAWFNSACGGGLVLKGVFGQGGDTAAQMVQATAQALAKNPDAVILVAGINDVYSLNLAPAVAWANIKALIDQVNAGGKVAICLAVTPVGSGNAGYSAQNVADNQTVNSDMQAYCAASPGNRLYVDAFTPMFDVAGQQAYSWSVYDTIHWTSSAGKVIGGDALGPALAGATALAPVLLPISAADTAAVNGWTKSVLKGPWTTTTGGTFGAGMSGTAPAGSSWTRSATGVGVCSIVDPGDGKGMFAQTVFTPGGVNEDMQYWPWTNTAPTIAALGVATTNKVMLACEIEWSGASASNLSFIEVKADSRTSGAPYVSNSIATDGESGETASGRFPDSGSQVFVTGPLQLNAAVATINLNIRARFFAASASALTLKVRRVCLYKL